MRHKFQIGKGFGLLTDDVEDHLLLRRTSLVKGENERQRDFLFIQIIPGRFAGQIGFLKIEKVVFYLEGEAQRIPPIASITHSVPAGLNTSEIRDPKEIVNNKIFQKLLVPLYSNY